MNWGVLWQVLPLPSDSCRLRAGPVPREALSSRWMWNSLQMKGACVEEKAPRGKAFVYSSVPLLFPTGNWACLVFPLSWASSSKGSCFHRAKGIQELQVSLRPFQFAASCQGAQGHLCILSRNLWLLTTAALQASAGESGKGHVFLHFIIISLIVAIYKALSKAWW